MKPEVEGGTPTGAEPQITLAGDWRIEHSEKSGRAVHLMTDEVVTLWKPREGCQKYNLTGRIISLVGTRLTTHVDEIGECTPAAGGNRFVTLDLSKKGPDKALKITDVFPADAVKDELANNSWLTNARSKPQLFSCLYSEDDLVSDHFAFHSIDGDSVKVRIGFGHGCPSHLGTYTQLDLQLKAPGKLRAEIEAADKKHLLARHLQPSLGPAPAPPETKE
jgi:hypothetical protein